MTLLYFFIDEQQEKDSPLHLQIKELKLYHSKQLQAIRSEIKMFQKAMYRATETNIYAQYTHNIIQSSFEKYHSQGHFSPKSTTGLSAFYESINATLFCLNPTTKHIF